MLLYDKTGHTLIADLSKNVISYIVDEERNGLFELTLVYPASYANYLDLKKENILIANASPTLKNQKFRIYNIRKKYNNTIEIIARHISYDLLDDFIENLNIENQSCEYCLNQLFKNSQFSIDFKGYSDIIAAQNYKIIRSNCLNAIAGQQGSILDVFGTGAELLRDNKNIHVLNRRGHDNGIKIAYGDNLTDFTCEEDTTNLITRIYPYVKRNDENNNEVIITLPDKFVDSPRINDYSHPYIRSIDFSDKFEQDEEVTTAKLKLEAEKYYIQNKCDIPKLTYTIDFVLIDKYNLDLCDTVTIEHKIYNIATQSKVIKSQFDGIKNRYVKMILGDAKASLGDLIGSGGSQIGPIGPPGKPGPVGPPGEEFPDTLPQIPVLEGKVISFASVDLSWSFENKVYYSYQLFASKIDEPPNTFNLIFEGQGSSFLHQVKPNETWYYWVRGLNTHGKATELSNKITVTTTKIDDFEAYFSSLAVEKLVVSMFSADYMEAGIVKGNWIDARQLSVTDGNGKRTLDIDSYGNVNLDVASLKIRSENIADNLKTLTDFKVNSEGFQTNIEKSINGRNLIINGNFENLLENYNTWKSNIYLVENGCKVVPAEHGNTDFGIQIPGFNLKANMTYTLSFNFGSYYNCSRLNYFYLLNTSMGNINLNSEVIIDGSTTNQQRVSISFSTNQAYNNIRALIGFAGNVDNSTGFIISEISLNEGSLQQNYTPAANQILSTMMNVSVNGLLCKFENGTSLGMERRGFFYYTHGMSHAYHCLMKSGIFNLNSHFQGGWTYVKIKLPQYFMGKYFEPQCSIAGYEVDASPVQTITALIDSYNIDEAWFIIKVLGVKQDGYNFSNINVTWFVTA